jgi:hypothetical protein
LRTKDFIKALLVALILGIPTVFLFSVVPSYSDIILVPNMPMEQYEALSTEARDEFLKSEDALRQVSGFEKLVFLVRERPEFYLLRLIGLAIPLFAAAAIGMAIAHRERGT